MGSESGAHIRNFCRYHPDNLTELMNSKELEAFVEEYSRRISISEDIKPGEREAFCSASGLLVSALKQGIESARTYLISRKVQPQCLGRSCKLSYREKKASSRTIEKKVGELLTNVEIGKGFLPFLPVFMGTFDVKYLWYPGRELPDDMYGLSELT